jgi:hypothetical protein
MAFDDEQRRQKAIGDGVSTTRRRAGLLFMVDGVVLICEIKAVVEAK